MERSPPWRTCPSSSGKAATDRSRATCSTPAEIIHLLRRLRESSLEARLQIPGLSPDRADIIVGGASVIARLVRGLHTQQIMVNERGIRDGLLLRMISELPGRRSSRTPQPGNRMEWARQFARKARSNERHCEQVATLALQIFDGLKNRFGLPAASRDLLQAAAILHDIGYLISHSKHHKHAYHLIIHGDLPGFTPHEVELIANVVRYHRRAFPQEASREPGVPRRARAEADREAERHSSDRRWSGPDPFPIGHRTQAPSAAGTNTDQRGGECLSRNRLRRRGTEVGPVPEGVRYRCGAGLALRTFGFEGERRSTAIPDLHVVAAS